MTFHRVFRSTDIAVILESGDVVANIRIEPFQGVKPDRESEFT